MTEHPKTEEEIVAARRALVEELEQIAALPKDAPDARPAIPVLTILTELLKHGGILSVSHHPRDIKSGEAVFLQLHQVGVNGFDLEKAIAAWRTDARAILDDDGAKEE